jgi:hypothetical protein
MPTLGKITRVNGVAGQFGYTVSVQYPDEFASVVTFVGSVYGGPVVLVTESGAQMFVDHPNRFGKFGPNWVRRFFSED